MVRCFRLAPLTVSLVVSFVCARGSVIAPEDSSHGGSPVFKLREVVITATRWQAALDAVPSPVSVVSREAIEDRPGNLLSSAMDGIPGVFIRSYGGGGSVQTISMRGMEPEHTLVLIDGQRYNSFQNGQSDFGILSSAGVDRIEIVRGGYSALYGSDAIGGVINVITRRPTEDPRASAAGAVGSNGYSAQEVSLSGSESSLGWTGTFRNETGRDDYEFEFNDGLMNHALRRNGNDFRLRTAESRLTYEFSDGIHADLSAFLTSADRGSPGPVTDIQSVGKARLSDDVARAQLGLGWTLTPDVSARLNSSFQYSRETYTDPLTLINGVPLNSLYTNRVFFMTPEVRFVSSPQLTASAGVDIAHAELVSSDVSGASRWQRSLFLATQHVLALPLVIPFEAVVYPSLRYDTFSDVAGDLSPKVGVNLGLVRDPEVRLRASYGKSFRAPSFNDLYWIMGGNPHLRPERSLGFDCGAVSMLPLFGTLRLDLSYFSISTSDRIVWVPGNGGLWSPVNITDVLSDGFEAEGEWTGFDRIVTIDVNSSWTTTRKESADFSGDPTQGKLLVYVPRQTVNVRAMLNLHGAALSVQHSWVSFRYTTEMNDRFLPGYSVLSAALRLPVRFGQFTASLKLEGTNLLNTSYQVIALYPMPLREFRLTAGAEL